MVTVLVSFCREFKKLRWLLQRQRHIKIELCIGLSVMGLFQVYIRLLGTNSFHIKAENLKIKGDLPVSWSSISAIRHQALRDYVKQYCACADSVFEALTTVEKKNTLCKRGRAWHGWTRNPSVLSDG